LSVLLGNLTVSMSD